MVGCNNLIKPQIEVDANALPPSRPWFKFFASDWRGDAALRMCSLAARGLWMEMLCVMHDGQPRGTLRINGRALSEGQFARLVGTTVESIVPLIEELEAAGVLSRDQDGCIFSRRMVRDEAKSASDKANGARGGNPRLKRSVERGVNPHANPQNPESKFQTSSLRSEEPSTAELFNTFWRIYPNNIGKAAALKAFAAALKRVGWLALLAGLERYVAKTDDRPWCNPATWLDQERWDDEPSVSSPRAQRKKTSTAVTYLLGRTLEALDGND